MSKPRLTKAQKIAMIEAYINREPCKVIAQRFGVNNSYPSILAKRRGLNSRHKSKWMTGEKSHD